MGSVPSCLERDSEKNNEEKRPMNMLRFNGKETIYIKRKRKRRRYCHGCHKRLDSCNNKDDKFGKTSILANSCVLKDAYYKGKLQPHVSKK